MSAKIWRLLPATGLSDMVGRGREAAQDSPTKSEAKVLPTESEHTIYKLLQERQKTKQKIKKQKTMKTKMKRSKWSLILAAFMVTLSTSCENNLIFEGEGDCGVYYNIHFKYDYNMKYANAFANEVNSVALFVFDQNGTLIESVVEDNATALSSESFSIPLELPRGNYELLSWAGLMDESSFDLLANVQEGVTKKEELKVKMNRTTTGGVSVVNNDLKPLYHGTLSLNVTDEEGAYHETMSLTKDTNVIRIVLQQNEESDLTVDEFDFEITAANGYYNWDNSLLADETIHYKPWAVSNGTASVGKAVTSVTVAVAEMTIGRMIDGQSPILTVKKKSDGEVVFQIPVADYALLVKGHYNSKMSNQEYLDRQDEYNMTFFLGEDDQWISSSIIINAWTVVLDDIIL